MNGRCRTKRFALLPLLLGAFLAAGCVRLDVTTRTEGGVIEPEQLQLVLRGLTTREYVIRMFGEPTSVRKTDDGAEELHYVGARQTTTRKKVFPVYSASSQKTTRVHTTFEIRDGKVQDYRIEEE